MSMLEKWRQSANLSRKEQATIWSQMNGAERKQAWDEYNASQRQQAPQKEPMSESERNYQRCVAGVDPDSEMGQMMARMYQRGMFYSFENRTIVDQDGIHQVRVRV